MTAISSEASARAAVVPVPVRYFTAEDLPPDAGSRGALERLAALPGLAQHVAVLPDVHYKPRNPTPTGTVAATRDRILPRAIDGGVNCGLRFLATDVPAAEFTPAVLDELYGRLLREVPLKEHASPLVGEAEGERVLTHGLTALVEALGLPPDELTGTERGGRALPHLSPEAIAAAIPRRAVAKGLASMGTVGAGNHFLELQEVAEVLDARAARQLGLERGRAAFMLHSDSRRLGRKDLKPLFEEAVGPGRDPWAPELWSVGVETDLGRRFLGGLAAATHAGFANRAAVTHILRGALRGLLGDASLRLVVDCGHESIHLEDHHGEALWVHRHGASHALPGRPVPVAGCLGTDSYLVIAEPGAAQTFFSIAHGAGRVIEKDAAAATFDQRRVEDDLARRGVRLYRYHADNIAGQAPASFKDITKVIRAMTTWKLVRPVARLRPVAALKG